MGASVGVGANVGASAVASVGMGANVGASAVASVSIGANAVILLFFVFF